MGPFDNTDESLLRSGILSDCEITCEGKTWKLHKSIICTRSGYFMALLLKNWKESKENKAEITLFNKEQIGVSFRPFEKTGTVLHTCAQLWHLGDYFLVPSLCDKVRRYIRLSVVPKTAPLARRQGWVIDGPDWLKAGQFVYDHFYRRGNSFCDAFLDMSLEKTFVRKQVLNLPQFKQLCKEWPDFGNDCMMKLVESKVTRLQ
ncbi:BTB/POZ domain-containing protein [Colletotrichum plurivorum]|uniref:BTB/POZ domain-containing protein n=1 Tax=Colletotrichum plurivorum TaxID=2175906 RepID=A0A8H6JPD5_9PEZI|nr:BTB/POZ domain-containing protein [Colletotrichum plurivorum]